MSRKKKSRRPRRGLQKLLVVVVALVIIGVVLKIFVYTPLKEKAVNTMTEKLIQSEIASDVTISGDVSAQEILDSMSEEDRSTVEQIMDDNLTPEVMAKASAYLAKGDTDGLKDYAKETLSDEEIQQVKDLYAKYKDQLPSTVEETP
jgi:cytoskeletal protein RodZ